MITRETVPPIEGQIDGDLNVQPGDQPGEPVIVENRDGEVTIISLPDRTLAELTADPTNMPQDLRDESGRHAFDKKPTFLTSLVVQASIVKGLISPEGQRRLKDIATEWAEMYERRAQMSNDNEAMSHLRQIWYQSINFLTQQLGIDRESFLDMTNQSLMALKQQEPQKYTKLPDNLPLRSLEGVRVAMLTVIPDAFASVIASASLVSEGADTIVMLATLEWDNQIREKKASLDADYGEKTADEDRRVQEAKISAESSVALIRTQNSSILEKGERVRQDLIELKAGRVIRFIVGATAPIVRWPIEAIKQLGSSLSKFAKEKPILATGSFISMGSGSYIAANYFLNAVEPSPVLVVLTAGGFLGGAVAQGLWDRFREHRQPAQHKS